MSDWQLPYAYDFHGREVRYGVVGEGAPLVLVHGTPWSSFNLRHLIEGLGRTHRVYFHDLVGYGQSDKSEGDVSLGVQNQVLDALLTHWELERPLVLGHDFGGATVLRTHLINGRSFEKIVLINPVALSPWGSPFFRHVRAHEAAFAGVPAYIHEAIVRAYIRTAAFRPLDADVLDTTVAPWRGDDGQAAFYRQIAQADAGFTEEIEPRYADINAPVLIVWGEEDTWIPVTQGRRLQQLIPGSMLRMVSDAGHLVIEERADELLRLVRPILCAGAQS